MILLTYGTRPEFLKISPIIDLLEKSNYPFKILHTNQHTTLADFRYDYRIDYKASINNRLDSIIGKIVSSNFIDVIQSEHKIDHILVQGDTASAFAVALSAFNNGINVIHLEAGLRTYTTTPWPEEPYRRMISHITNIHLCPTEANLSNLKRERIKGSAYVIGNTSIDNLLPYKDKCVYDNKVLITLHRRENQRVFKFLCAEMEDLANDYPQLEFIFPMHPSPEIRKHASIFKKVNVIDPLSHKDLLDILVQCKLVITDSGGIQEECSFLNKKCLVCRTSTEREESLSKSSFLVNDLKSSFDTHILTFDINYACPYGDGTSSKKFLEILKTLQHG